MFGRDQSGVAVLAVVIIVAASTGVAVATPVVVDAVDVDPDSPFYGLERLGEQIRMVNNEDQMKERWSEYARMADRGKGIEYKNILEEFVGKMHDVAPENVGAKQEMVRWMQEQMPGVGLVKLRLMRELCLELRENLPEVSGELENELSDLENIEQVLLAENYSSLENIGARLELKAEHLRQIAERYENRLRERVHRYFDIDNILVDIDVTVNVEVDINIVRPIPITAAEFENELENFNTSLSEVQAMLEGTPENVPGRNAAERLVELAIKLKDNAVAAHEAGENRKALVLIHAAQVHLRNAETILNHASEWEPEFRENWTNWKELWENMKQRWIENGNWQSIIENYGQHIEQVRHQWQEKWRERWQEILQQTRVGSVRH